MRATRPRARRRAAAQLELQRQRGVKVEEQEHHLTVRGVGPGRHRFVLAKVNVA